MTTTATATASQPIHGVLHLIAGTRTAKLVDGKVYFQSGDAWRKATATQALSFVADAPKAPVKAAAPNAVVKAVAKAIGPKAKPATKATGHVDAANDTASLATRVAAAAGVAEARQPSKTRAA